MKCINFANQYLRYVYTVYGKLMPYAQYTHTGAMYHMYTTCQCGSSLLLLRGLGDILKEVLQTIII